VNYLVAHFPLNSGCLKAELRQKVGFVKISLRFRPTFVTRPRVCGYGAGRKENGNDPAAEDARIIDQHHSEPKAQHEKNAPN
jgi:hypothetical protein